MTALVWLRRDLRRRDLPLLKAAHDAVQDKGEGDVHVVFVVDPRLWGHTGTVRTAWLAATLKALDTSYDGRLTLKMGDPRTLVPHLAADLGAGSVHVSSEPFPYGRRRDEVVRAALEEQGVEWVETGSPYAITPGRITKGDGEPYKVFTPFSRAWREHGWPSPAEEPSGLSLATADSDKRVAGMIDKALRDGPEGMPEAGEDAALERWGAFLDGPLSDYATDRDRPAVAGTSQLSPYLKLGVVHPRTLLADLASKRSESAATYTDELCWRDFYADVLWQRPDSAWKDYRTELSSMHYDDGKDAEAAVEAWKQGRTGFPIVDAGMRQLLESGWMHNRVRMITASFFAKDLHQWWPEGARHFLEHLMDGDVASNNHGWQWAAGTGTDAAPYFRVFNPITQGLKFDPTGDYVRRWVPELAHLEGRSAHEPWDAEGGYDHDYPERIVDHAEERKEALARYQAAR